MLGPLSLRFRLPWGHWLFASSLSAEALRFELADLSRLGLINPSGHLLNETRLQSTPFMTLSLSTREVILPQ
jgi:hypothetical protein